jgi:hypothetical protein
VCAEIDIKVAATRAERRDAFELVYSAYRRAGLCAENPFGLRFTPYQVLPSTDIFIAKFQGEVISTLSLVRDGELGLPLEDIYGEEVASRRAAGVKLAEVSCLADRRESPRRFFDLFCDMSRLMAQVARTQGVDELLVAVHPRHAAIYGRYMAFEPMGDRRDYPTVCGSPAVALSLNFDRAAIYQPKCWQRFFAEQLPDEAVVSCPISASDRDYFLSLSHDEKLCSIAFGNATGNGAKEGLLCA